MNEPVGATLTWLSVEVPGWSFFCTDRSSANSGRFGNGSNLLMTSFSFC